MMQDSFQPEDLWRAISIYLELAYPGSPPQAVQKRLDQLRAAPENAALKCAVLESDPPDLPTCHSIRLGNRFYPHMKLVMEIRPDRAGYLFRVDTHDQHACPAPASPDYEPYRTLMNLNRDLAQRIEAAWEKNGVHTFKAYLKDDLARRTQKP